MSFNKRMLSAGAAPFVPSEHFKAVKYAGNGSTQSITVGFQPDIVWIKELDDGNENWNCYDSSRGVRRFMGTHSNAAEVLGGTGRLTSFDSTGFTMGSDNEINDSGANYVAYCWKVGGGSVANNTDGNATSSNQVNLDAGVSIMKLDSHSGSYTIGHGLGAEPDLVITKVYSGTTGDWHVYHTTNDSGKWTVLNGFAATQTASAGYEYHTVNSSLVGNLISNSSLSYIHYAWKSIAGFSKFGSYEGNSSDSGPIIETGFEPALVIIKNSSDAGSWFIYDNARSTSNPRKKYILANGQNVEASDLNGVAFLSNGFQILEDHDDINDTGDTYIYMAWATDADEDAPTLADSFTVETYTGSASSQTINNAFKAGLIWTKSRTGSASHWGAFDTVTGVRKYLTLNNNTAQNEGNADADQGIETFGDTSTTFYGNRGRSNSAYQSSTYVGYFWAADDNEPKVFGGPPEAVYTFESNANDLTGMKNGTANNITYASGKFGNAAVFNGTDGDIDMPADWEGSQVISVSLWLYLDDNAPTNQIVLEFDNSCGLNFPSAASGKLAAQYHNANSKHTLSNSALSNNTWYHVVANFNNGSTGSSELWLNGVKQTSGGTVTDYLTADENTIGSRRSGEFLDGMIDQLRVFNYHLSQNEVDLLYAETSANNEDIDYGAKPMAVVSINANAGFSVSKMTFPGEGIIPHGLSSTPEFVILKATSSAEDWQVFHTSNGTGKYLLLNENDAVGTRADSFSAVNATGVTNQWTNASQTWIMYSWHPVAGYSKFGTYTGNGGASNNAITGVGFQPDFVVAKSTGSDNWRVYDSVRGDKVLYTNLSNNEDSSAHISYQSDGFTWLTDNNNAGSTTYVYAAFKINLTASVASGEMTYLIAAGGGGSSSDSGGGAGGGAGGLRTSFGSTSGGGADAENNITLSSGKTYTFTVGAGGAGTDGSGEVTSANGADSSIAATGLTTITSTGGGGGGDYYMAGNTGIGKDGGSGGGGINLNGSVTRAGGAGTANQGYAGGTAVAIGSNDGDNASGGGGGASAVGGNASAAQGGIGGAGLAVNINEDFATYAGGGGGGTRSAGSGGAGGAGGGGAGVTSGNGNAGTANTGGGGGAGRSNGASGGSGVVIVRLLTSEYSGLISGSPTVTTRPSMGETILKYTGTGKYAHGSFPASGKMSYLVLAGGASGASNGGGGGAGGLRTSYPVSSGGGAASESDITLSTGTYTVTIGGGGAGLDNTNDYQDRGNAGSSSTISNNASVSTNGGGAPGSNNELALSGGGCGGGQGAHPSSARSAQAGTSGEGYAGGATPTTGHPYRGGGGGGTGQAGFSNNAGSDTSNGGDGLASLITGSSVNYGAGGGGTGGTGSGYTGAGGTGGTGGGGNGGAYNGSGTAGTANTGSGGGATGDAGTLTSGAGGSGVVILRLLTSQYSGTTSGSPTITTDGSYTVLKFTGSGSYTHS